MQVSSVNVNPGGLSRDEIILLTEQYGKNEFSADAPCTGLYAGQN